ncbi:MAG: hypothetical protein K9N55_17615, partial [Phycisphaerae bacterium]|nr:hypothetical protein [Phycisphaerae bacterium]
AARGSGQCVLTEAELNQIFTSNRIVIGDPTAGVITFTDAVDLAGSPVLELISGASIGDAHQTGFDFVGGLLVLNGCIWPGQSPGVLSISGDVTLAANTTLDLEIGGDTPGTGTGNHDQLDVSHGIVMIGSNVALHMVPWDNFIPTGGEQIVIIDNQGSDAIVGRLANYAEGTTITDFLGSGLEAVFSYQSGDGNDAVVSVNARPIAEAGGPYSVAEGATITLDGSGSYDPDQHTMPLIYEWDLDNDGQYDDATGIRPTFSGVGLDGPMSVTVGLKVTDHQGASDTDTATVNLTNRDPVLDDLAVTVLDANGHVTLSGSYSDEGTLDTHVLTIDWGDGVVQDVSVSGWTFAIGHTYDTHDPAAKFTIGVILSDDDGGRAGIAGIITGYNPHDVHAAPVVTVSDITVVEGSSGDYIQKADFEVVLSQASHNLVQVSFESLDLTAIRIEDHWAMSRGTLYFYPGVTRVVLTMVIREDLIAEQDETFALHLTETVNAVIRTPQAVCTIIDDDSVVPTPVITGIIQDTGARDGRTSDSTVRIDGTASDSDAVEVFLDNTSIGFATVNADGTWILDYSSVILPDGTYLLTAQALDVVGLRSVLSDPYTLIIDQSDLLITVDDVTVTEGDDGRVYAYFPIHLSQTSNQRVEVSYVTSNGTAVSPTDYHTASGTVWFFPGVTSLRLPVNVFGDTTPEINEQFTLTLTATTIGQIVDNTAVCTILDHDIQYPMPVEQSTGGADGFDLAHTSVTFAQDTAGAYTVTSEPINSLPVSPIGPTGGTPVPAGNNVSTRVVLSDPLGASSEAVTLFNETYSDLYINTHGSVSPQGTFGFGQPVTDPTESMSNHSAVAQVSALFTASQGTFGLDTSLFGRISYKSLPDRIAVTWSNVPAFGVTDYTRTNIPPGTFCFPIELYDRSPGPGRRMRLSWLDITQDHAIVDLSEF